MKNITPKSLILNPKDGISDIIYQIKSDIVKGDKVLIYIPDNMDILYNPINRGLFIHTIKQLLSKNNIELSSSDNGLVSLLSISNIPITNSNSLPHAVTETTSINIENDPYTDFFGYQLNQNITRSTPESNSAEVFQPEPTNPQPLIKKKSDVLSWKFVLRGVIMITIILITGFSIFIPRADITITTKLESLSKDFDITFDPSITDISVGNKATPSTTDTISASVEGTYEGTGSQVGGSKANATITIKNETKASQSLVSNTRFLSSKGKQFRLTEAVTIPAQDSVLAKIIADNSGEDYNIPAGKLTIPGFEDNSTKFAAIYGELGTAISNGASEDGIVVVEKDIEKARTDLQKKLTEIVNQQIGERKDTKALAIQTKLNDIQFTGLPNIGDRSRSFTVKASGNIQGLFYKEENLNKLIQSLLASQVIDSRELGSDIKINFDPPQEFPNKQAVRARVYVDYSLQPKFDEGDISRNIRFKTISQAQDYIKSLDNVDSADIKLIPGFIPVLPVLSSRISIIIK
jgi:hypothetical protein